MYKEPAVRVGRVGIASRRAPEHRQPRGLLVGPFLQVGRGARRAGMASALTLTALERIPAQHDDLIVRAQHPPAVSPPWPDIFCSPCTENARVCSLRAARCPARLLWQAARECWVRPADQDFRHRRWQSAPADRGAHGTRGTGLAGGVGASRVWQDSRVMLVRPTGLRVEGARAAALGAGP